MADDPSVPPSGAGPRSKTSAYVAALRIPFTLLCLVGGVLAAYHFLYVAAERDYLTGRNFRLLSTMGEQIDAAIANDQTVLTNLLKVDRANGESLEDVFRAPLTAEFVPILRTAKISFPALDPTGPDASPVAVVTTFAERESRFTWTQPDDTAPASLDRSLQVRLELDDLLMPFLGGELQTSVFDAVLVAASDGRVIFQTGDSKLRMTRVDKLEIDAKPPRDLDFAKVARSSAMVDVQISGSRYKLLMQPCCGRMARETTADHEAGGWVLCGLMAERTMTAASSAVSFAIMALLMALLLLALFSWPFLKLMFIGEAQRVRAHDVVLVGLGALLAVSLVTVSTLDLYAYWHLGAVLDNQLQRFASSIKLQAKEEIAAAYAELTRLETALPLFEQPVATNLASNTRLFNEGGFNRYPFFESISFMDAHGAQKRKLAFDSFVTPLVDVGQREYFRYWKSPRTAPAFLQPVRSVTTGATEAVLSKSQSAGGFAVTALTIPMHALIDPVLVPGFGFAVIDGDGRVLFHSDPHHNLSENYFVESDGNRRLKALASARHEEWVDVKYWGDDHRAFVTPIELSVDDPSKPIALFGQPWTLVTFYDMDLARTVNVEWLVIIVAFLLTYAAVYVAIGLGVLLVGPNYRAPWLWPDPTRSRAYLDVIPPLLILSAAFAVSIVFLAPADLMGSAVLLPFLAWILTYRGLAPTPAPATWTRAGAIGLCLVVVLLAAIVRSGLLGWRGVLVAMLGGGAAWTTWRATRRRPKRSSPLTLPVNVSYGFAAGLLLLLAAALPAAAFFKVAYDTELESFIKYGQLQIALDRSDHESRSDDIIARRITDPATAQRVRQLRANYPKWWGGYDTFFFCTQPPRQPADRAQADASGCPAVDPGVGRSMTSSDPVAVPAIVEGLLPFYSESSVRLREMVHDRAADRSWSWRRAGGNLLLSLGAADAPAFVSIKPPFIEWPGGAGSSFWDVLLLAIMAIAVIGAVVWVIRFILHKVFVVDVIEPLWSGTSEPVRDIQPHLLIVSAEAAADPRSPATYCDVDLAQAPSEDPAESKWFDKQIHRFARAAGSRDLLLLHFEERLHDRLFNERKLTLAERAIHMANRNVIIISAVPPQVICAASRPEGDQTAVAWTRRWTALLSHFTIVPAAPAAAAPTPALSATTVLADWTTVGWREILWRLNALGFAHSATFLENERRDPVVGRLWKDVLPYAWHPDSPPLGIAQLVVEVGERAERYYREIWATCTLAEKLVLGQLAEEGLVNDKTKRTVRALMARGLVRRQPHFVLMSETFRQFVLSPHARREVEALEEESSGAWDVIRWPFVIILVGSLGFFFATQQELFKTVLGVLTAAAAVVPAVVKMASLFGERGSGA